MSASSNGVPNGRRGSRPNKYDRRGIDALTEIRGISARSVKDWLHVAKDVGPEKEIMYSNIHEYIRNSQEHNFGLKVLSITRIVRKNTTEFPNDPVKKGKFRMMLWHGTKEKYVPNILEHGFQPPAANNQMFGKGIYFADRASKSANYCVDSKRRPLRPITWEIGYLFLCDVMIGDHYNAKNAKNEYTSAPTTTNSRGETKTWDSVKCTGRKIPTRKEQKEFKGSVIPLGRTIPNTQFPSYTLDYNEYIVYNPEQVKPMYLVKIEFRKEPYPY